MNIATYTFTRALQIAGTTFAIFIAGTFSLNAKADENEQPKLAIYVNDLKGEAWTGVLNAREELMHQAIDEAVAREDWIEDYEFEYNTLPDENETSFVKINIIEWERTRTNFYNFSANVAYVDADGNEHQLGTFRGTRSGISVINNRDRGEAYAQVAEDAIIDAFDELTSKTGYSS